VRRISLVALLIILIFVVSGCGRNPEAVRNREDLPFGLSEATSESGGSSATAKADAKAESAADKESTADSGNASEAETVTEFYDSYDSGSDEIEGVSKDMMNCSFDSFLTWAGLQYFYELEGGADFDGLSTQKAVQIAAFNATFMNENLEYTSDGSGLIIPADILSLSMYELFGQVYDVTQYDNSKDDQCCLVYTREDGSATIGLGDWGTVAPQYVIENVKDKGNGEFTVKVCYLAYDFEEGKPLDNRGMDAEYECKVSPDTAFGFVITDMRVRVTSKF